MRERNEATRNLCCVNCNLCIVKKYCGNKCMGICEAKAYLKDTHVPLRIMKHSSTKTT